MDKNQITGLLLIGAILLVYTIWMQPTPEEIEATKHKRDSVALVEQEMEHLANLQEIEQENPIQQPAIDTSLTDSASIAEREKSYGKFAEATIGEQKFITLENQFLKFKISTLGGRPYSVELKNYKTHDSLPLILFDGNENSFGLNFHANSRNVSTNNLYFEPVSSEINYIVDGEKKSVKLRLHAGADSYIEYVYSLDPNSYLINYHINMINMDKIISRTSNFINLEWNQLMVSLEKGIKWENDNTTIYYKYFQDATDYLTEMSDEEEETLSTRVKWISYKQQFFSSVLIANTFMNNAKVSYTKLEGSEKYTKSAKSEITLVFQGLESESIPFTFYFGPNQHKILTNIHLPNDDEDLNLDKMIPLGWGIFGWVNRWAVIPVFNFLGNHFVSYGLIIFLLTIIIKLVLFPLTFKSYQSTAKMRVLKPEIDAINERIPKDKAMERQQATMALYKKAGVNPMGGCLPMLLQMPILFAMFRFFPSSIELRQKGFLWADDLSTYDSILSLPFEIPFYGEHVSLFTLLMAGSIVLTTIVSNQQMSSNQIPGMKMMLYLMPVMMVFWFNNYSSGLSYYYFLSNLITFGQTILIRKFINDDDLLKKIQLAKKKPTKKSNFQKRLDDMSKQQKKKKK